MLHALERQTKNPKMKTLLKIFITTISFTLAFCAVKAQSASNDEPITLETLLQMHDGENGAFGISPLRIVSANNGFRVQWKTINEHRIASFELETGATKKSFTSVKKIAARNAACPSNLYDIGFTSADVSADKLHLRIKINYEDGTSQYINETAVKMRKRD